MDRRKKTTAWLTATLSLLVMAGCSNSSDSGKGSRSGDEATQLVNRFGDLSPHFSLESMSKVVEYADTGRSLTLVQLMSINDQEIFARYEEQSTALWESVGAQEVFRSETFGQMLGDRAMNQTRVVEFSSVESLLSTIDTPAFTDVMDTLAKASDDHAWVLGELVSLPFLPGGSYFDPALQNLDATAASALLGVLSNGPDDVFESGSDIASSQQTIIDMVVSDAPSPFWMVNLIDYYDRAQFPDKRETDLTGKEANDIYGNAVLPFLLRYNSVPAFVIEVTINLTEDDIEWEQAAIVRYASRDAFLNAFPLNPSLNDFIVYKAAGVKNTLVYATEVPDTVQAAPVNGPLFNYRYCEVLLLTQQNVILRADVFNSMPLGNCPQAEWDSLDAGQIAAEYDVPAALLNGIRFWVLDRIESAIELGPLVLENFGGIPMRLAASVELAAGRDSGELTPYAIARVSRDTIFHYVAGRQIYELADPSGTRYRMQSFTRSVDPDQQLIDLQHLGQRLALPLGWSFHVTLLQQDSELATVAGIAEVITDDLGNTYQRVP